jgi:hypothetical protein
MAKFQADDPKEFAKLVEAQAKAIDRLLVDLQNEGKRKMVQAGRIIEARSKEIITEKNHIVTGTLRRTMNTQLLSGRKGLIEVEVGNPMVYAPAVEALPNTGGRAPSVGPRGGKIPGRGQGGGFLNPAAVQTFAAVTDFLAREWLTPTLRKNWTPK